MSEQNSPFRNLTLLDASEQAEAQDWLPLEMNQISPGSYSGQMRVFEHDDVSVYFETQNSTIHKRGVMDEKLCTVSFFLTNQADCRFSEYNPADHSLFFLPSGTEFDINVPGNIETVYFRYDQESLLDKARAINPSRWESSPTNLKIFNQVDRSAVDIFTEQLLSSSPFNNHPDVTYDEGLITKTIMDLVLMSLESPSPHETEIDSELRIRRRADHIVNGVIEYINAQLDQHFCPSISDICYDMQISERNLQYSFKKIVNLSPITYFRYLRLNRARAELMRPANATQTVTDIAMHWHFLHLGRFSKDYLHLFGELPSTTLHRALA